MDLISFFVPKSVNSTILTIVGIALITHYIIKIKHGGFKSVFNLRNIVPVSVVILIILTPFIQIIIRKISGTSPTQLQQARLLVPTTVMSIILSLVGLATLTYLIISIKRKGVENFVSFKNLLITLFLIAIIIFGANSNFVNAWPYGTLSATIINFATQILLYGFLLPYLVVVIITYLYMLYKGQIKKL